MYSSCAVVFRKSVYGFPESFWNCRLDYTYYAPFPRHTFHPVRDVTFIARERKEGGVGHQLRHRCLPLPPTHRILLVRTNVMRRETFSGVDRCPPPDWQRNFSLQFLSGCIARLEKIEEAGGREGGMARLHYFLSESSTLSPPPKFILFCRDHEG